jgi:SAM-dependent methyltransferase
MSPWRKQLYAALARETMTGKVVDLGGDRRSGYHALIRGEKRVEVVNIMKDAGPDHVFDLEEMFPLASSVYDGVLSMNILEHIYRYQQFLSECVRILKPGGSILLAVPFAMQVHPSPRDHFRYTGETLERIFAETGFRDVRVIPVGKGPFTAAAQLAHNPLAKIPLLAPLHAACAGLLDSILQFFDRKGTFGPSRYPLGYLVAARTH